MTTLCKPNKYSASMPTYVACQMTIDGAALPVLNILHIDVYTLRCTGPTASSRVGFAIEISNSISVCCRPFLASPIFDVGIVFASFLFTISRFCVEKIWDMTCQCFISLSVCREFENSVR